MMRLPVRRVELCVEPLMRRMPSVLASSPRHIETQAPKCKPPNATTLAKRPILCRVVATLSASVWACCLADRKWYRACENCWPQVCRQAAKLLNQHVSLGLRFESANSLIGVSLYRFGFGFVLVGRGLRLGLVQTLELCVSGQSFAPRARQAAESATGTNTRLGSPTKMQLDSSWFHRIRPTWARLDSTRLECCCCCHSNLHASLMMTQS